MENILSLDISTKRSGWACIIENELKYGAITSASTSVEKRITVMRDSILELVKKYNITKIIVEEVRPDNSNNRTEKVLTWLQGCLIVALYEYDKNIDVQFIGPSSWRSVIGIQGYRIKREQQKQKDIAYANQKYNLNLTSLQDDEADAICILTAFNINSGVAETPIKVKKEIGSDESAF